MTNDAARTQFTFANPETHEELTARKAKKIQQALIKATAEKEFPYLLQDPAFHHGVCEYLKVQQPSAEDGVPYKRTLEKAATDLHHGLIAITSARCNRCAPVGRKVSDYPETLLELFPAYQQMAREAAKNDNSIAVRFFARPNKKAKAGDYWKDRVEELRGADAQRS